MKAPKEELCGNARAQAATVQLQPKALMQQDVAWQSITAELAVLIQENGWEARFNEAAIRIEALQLKDFAGPQGTAGLLKLIDSYVTWVPCAGNAGAEIHDRMVAFHFIFAQPTLRELQGELTPEGLAEALTPLSRWLCEFDRLWGKFLDRPESASHIDTFRTAADFRWDDYMPPPSGYLTFNQFFGRHVKPGRRPVAVGDGRNVASPADSTFIGQWPITRENAIELDDPSLPVKGLRWTLKQLLDGSPYADRFAGGVITHSGLRAHDYHRFHAPIAGRVVESRVVNARVWLDVFVTETRTGEDVERKLEASEGTGYQFGQTRGIIVLDTAFGLVACLPVGMAQVSSVVLTAECDATLRQGEELGYFQFGGSDLMMIFEERCDVVLDRREGVHHFQGEAVGRLGGATP